MKFNFKYQEPEPHLHTREIDHVVIDGVDYSDYPDFCDAYVDSMDVLDNGKWRKATENELDQISESDLCYKLTIDSLF